MPLGSGETTSPSIYISLDAGAEPGTYVSLPEESPSMNLNQRLQLSTGVLR
jgi:hypothetical protein